MSVAALGMWSLEDQGNWTCLGYIASWRPAWATEDIVSKQTKRTGREEGPPEGGRDKHRNRKIEMSQVRVPAPKSDDLGTHMQEGEK